jgi:hypothetical protein
MTKQRGFRKKVYGKGKNRYVFENYKIGQKRVHEVCRMFSKRGYNVYYADASFNGVDIQCFKIPKVSGVPDIVIESTNYAKTSFVSRENFDRYLKNLNAFPTSQKILVISFKTNINQEQRSILINNHIIIRVIGKQT